MDNKYLRTVAVVLGLAAFAGLAEAQTIAGVNGIFVAPFKATPAGQVYVAADTTPALYVKYFAPAGATIPTSTTTLAVEAAGTGDLTFVVNGAAYAGFECPVVTTLGGVIDVSDAACDTLGEVVDVINATAPTFSTGYFRAVIAAGLRSDTSTATLLARAASTLVGTPAGQVVFWDSSVNDDQEVGLWDTTLGIQNWLNNNRLLKNPFEDQSQVLLYLHEKVTNAGTITNVEVHCTKENYLDGRALSSEVDSIIYLEAAGATTAVGKIDEFINAGGLVCKGGKLWARVLASGGDNSATEIFSYGYTRPKQ